MRKYLFLLIALTNTARLLAQDDELIVRKHEFGLQFLTIFPERIEGESRLRQIDLGTTMPLILQYRHNFEQAPVSARTYLKSSFIRNTSPVYVLDDRVATDEFYYNEYGEFRNSASFFELALGLQGNFEAYNVQVYSGFDFLLLQHVIKTKGSVAGYEWNGGLEARTHEKEESYTSRKGLGFAVPVGVNVRLYPRLRLTLEATIQHEWHQVRTIDYRYSFEQISSNTPSEYTISRVYDSRPKVWSVFKPENIKMMVCYSF